MKVFRICCLRSSICSDSEEKRNSFVISSLLKKGNDSYCICLLLVLRLLLFPSPVIFNLNLILENIFSLHHISVFYCFVSLNDSISCPIHSSIYTRYGSDLILRNENMTVRAMILELALNQSSPNHSLDRFRLKVGTRK